MSIEDKLQALVNAIHQKLSVKYYGADIDVQAVPLPTLEILVEISVDNLFDRYIMFSDGYGNFSFNRVWNGVL